MHFFALNILRRVVLVFTQRPLYRNSWKKARLKCDFHSDKPQVDFDDGNPCSCLYLMVQYLFVLQFHLISEKKKFVKTCPDFTRKGYACRLQTLWQASSNFLAQQSNFKFKFSSSLLEIWTPLKIWPHRRD